MSIITKALKLARERAKVQNDNFVDYEIVWCSTDNEYSIIKFDDNKNYIVIKCYEE